MRRGAAIGLCLALSGGAALAQTGPQVDCASPGITAPETRYCAFLAYEEADAALNHVYRLALVRAKAFDQETAAQGLTVALGVEEALRQAQRDWLAWRDSSCDAEVALSRGDVGAPERGSLCRARQTITRTEDLRAFAPDLDAARTP